MPAPASPGEAIVCARLRGGSTCRCGWHDDVSRPGPVCALTQAPSALRAAPPPPQRMPLEVQCKPCGFRWTAAYLPMEVGKIARMLRGLGCPMCGAHSRQIHIAIDTPSAQP